MPEAPNHGFARTRMWNTDDQSPTHVVLSLETDGTDPTFPHKAHVTLRVEVSDALTLTLTTRNTGTTTFTLSQALHTYLRVSDVFSTPLGGFGGAPHRPTASHMPLPPHADPLLLTDETDTVYHNLPATLTVTDEPNRRCLHIDLAHTQEAVLWTPGAAKAKTLDMPPNTYPHVLCIEPAHLDTAPTLAPGTTTSLGTTLHWEPL